MSSAIPAHLPALSTPLPPPHCTYPWSDRDAFTYVSDCHVYKPLDVGFQALVLFLAALCFTFGLAHSWRQARKDMAVSCTVFFILSYAISLGLNISFADRNYGLNIIHGIARGFIWVVVNVFNVRHLEVIMSVDAHTVAKSQGSTALLMKFNTALCIFSLIAEVLIMLIPTADKNLRFYDFIGPATIILVVINSTPRCVYAYQVRKLVLEAQQVAVDPEFYVPIKKQLEVLIYGSGFGALGGLIIQMLCINLPVLYYNFYIAYTLQMVGGPYTGLVSLVNTAKASIADKGGTTKTEKPLRHHSSRKLATTNTTLDEDESSNPLRKGLSSTALPSLSPSASSQVITLTATEMSPLFLEEKSMSGVGVGGVGGDIENSLLQSSKGGGESELRDSKPIFNPFTIAEGTEATDTNESNQNAHNEAASV